AHLKEHWPTIRAQLLEGTYKPQPVRRAEIPKASGGLRAAWHPDGARPLHPASGDAGAAGGLGQNVLKMSFGFRRGSRRIRRWNRCGRISGLVVDIDLEKFFDRVNHDILMGLIAKRVADKRILKLIRGFLTAGALEGGLASPTEEGAPQGGPLSPLL